MGVFELLMSAGSALSSNKLRSALTALGIVIGVGAAIIWISAI